MKATDFQIRSVRQNTSIVLTRSSGPREARLIDQIIESNGEDDAPKICASYDYAHSQCSVASNEVL